MTESCVWDLRRGDYDDNRTSPHGRGLRSMVVSALLEFNYLTAPVIFFALVVGPALVVGIVPSLLLTYAGAISKTPSSGTGLFVGLALIAALVVVALWIGRRLLEIVFAEFRDLHYTFLFPVFVAVREVLCTALESFAGKSIPPERLQRIRKVGTVMAAIVVGSAGIALAAMVEFSTGLKLVNVERVRLWISVKAALCNAVVIIGLSTAVESLYWLWYELAHSRPILDWRPNFAPDAPSFRIAHMSDLHVVGERYGYRMEAGSHGPQGNERICNAFGRLTELHRSRPLDQIFITGDITDAGTRAEWAEFMDICEDFPGLCNRVSMVPGNHDVNIVDRNTPGRLDMPWSASQWLRKLRVVLALDHFQGQRSFLVDRKSGQLSTSLHDYLRQKERLDRLRSLANNGAFLGRWEIARTWDAIFPLVEPASADRRCGLILLDSNARSHFSLTNALGVISPSQLRGLKLLLRKSPDSAWFILLHHAIVEYPIQAIPLRDRVGLALVNARDLLAAIAPYGSRVMIFHGHRHWDWIGTCGDVVVCSAASVSLGSGGREHYQGCFQVHEVALNSDRNLRLNKTHPVSAM